MKLSIMNFKTSIRLTLRGKDIFQGGESMISQRGGSRTPTPEGATYYWANLPPPKKKLVKMKQNWTINPPLSLVLAIPSKQTLLHFKSIIGDTLLPTTFFNSRSLKMFLEVDRVLMRMDKLS